MWTRVKLFFRSRSLDELAASFRRTQADLESVRGLVFAVSQKLTYLQARQTVTAGSVGQLDDAVTKLVAERYPDLEKSNAEAAAERVRRGLKARGVMPVLPSLTGTECAPGYEYAVGPSPDDDPSAPDCEVEG